MYENMKSIARTMYSMSPSVQPRCIVTGFETRVGIFMLSKSCNYMNELIQKKALPQKTEELALKLRSFLEQKKHLIQELAHIGQQIEVLNSNSLRRSITSVVTLDTAPGAVVGAEEDRKDGSPSNRLGPDHEYRDLRKLALKHRFSEKFALSLMPGKGSPKQANEAPNSDIEFVDMCNQIGTDSSKGSLRESMLERSMERRLDEYESGLESDPDRKSELSESRKFFGEVSLSSDPFGTDTLPKVTASIATSFDDRIISRRILAFDPRNTMSYLFDYVHPAFSAKRHNKKRMRRLSTHGISHATFGDGSGASGSRKKYYFVRNNMRIGGCR